MRSQLRTVFNRLPRPSASLLIPLIACLYVGLIILLPALEVVAGAFAKGLTPFLENFQSDELRSAVLLTLRCTLIAVPANTIFGLAAATAIARRQFPGKALLLSVIDLPFTISPVVVGLMLVLLYSPTNGLLGGIDSSLGWQSIYSWPGMGRLLLERIYLRDYPTIQGVIIVFALMVAGISPRSVDTAAACISRLMVVMIR